VGGKLLYLQNRAKVHPWPKTWLFIHRRLASQTFEHFFPELKDVAFCILILKRVDKNKNLPCFDQVKTYLVKYDFEIVADV
jgi:hypothetical protein